MSQSSEAKFTENVRTVVNAVLTQCRKVITNYINVYKTMSCEPVIPLHECEAVNINLINYISLMTKIMNGKPVDGANQQRSKWMTALEPHLLAMSSDRMSVFGDMGNPVIVKIEPPNSKAEYEVHLTKIYMMANDTMILTNPSTSISEMRQALISSLINMAYLFFEDYRMSLKGVKDKYSPNAGGMKFLDDIMGEIPQFLQSQIPDNSIDTSLITSTIQGLIPKPGESEEDVQNKIKSVMRSGNLTSLMEKIQRG